MTETPKARRRGWATLVGAAAVLCWGSESALTTYAARIPPFEIAFLGFAAVALAISPYFAFNPRRTWMLLKQPPGAWALGVFSLLGFHVCLYRAVETAPPAQAALLQGFTPLIIVLGSAWLPGERLRAWHLIGVAMGFSGALWLVLGDVAHPPRALGFPEAHDPRQLWSAVAAAAIWATYSLGNRRFPHVPTLAVGPFCLAASIAALAGHLLFEPWVAPLPHEWIAVAALGLVPAGLASFLWDFAVKQGDIQVLGVIGYGEPLLGAAMVIGVGAESASWRMAWSAALIIGGSLVASHHLWLKPNRAAKIKETF